jgi:hypothetical protein
MFDFSPSISYISRQTKESRKHGGDVLFFCPGSARCFSLALRCFVVSFLQMNIATRLLAILLVTTFYASPGGAAPPDYRNGGSIHVAAIQLQPIDGDIAASQVKISELVRQTAARGAKYILLPEYYPGQLPIELWRERRRGPPRRPADRRATGEIRSRLVPGTGRLHRLRAREATRRRQRIQLYDLRRT